MIDGMFCAACAASLEYRFERLPGVAAAAVDLAAGAALLRWHPGEANPQGACELASALGYHARRPDTPSSRRGTNDPAKTLRINLAIAVFFGMWTMLPSIALYLDAAPAAPIAHSLAWAAGLASLPVIVIAGRPFYTMALASLAAGAAGIDVLVTLGVLGALILSSVSLARGGSEVYFEVAVALITLQLLARLIELNVARAGRDAVARLLDLAPPRVLRLNDSGVTELVPVGDIRLGDLILAEAGETVALDGEVASDAVRLDRHLLSGESRAVLVHRGEPVCAGEVVIEGPLMLRVTAAAGERRIDALAREVRMLIMEKPDWQRSVDVVARHFLLLATLAAGVGALLAALSGADTMAIAQRALAVFVIACPCALSLAAPLAGLGASRHAADGGILLRDLRIVTNSGKINALFLDKTGTLTEGCPSVHSLLPVHGTDERELLEVAARVEKLSRHPFAVAITQAAVARGIDLQEHVPGDENRAQRRTVVGCGVSLLSESTILRVGSREWFATLGLECPPLDESGHSRVWVACDDRVLGAVDLCDALRAGVSEAIAELRREGVDVTILSGDAAEPVAQLAAKLNVKGIARCSPEDKVVHVKSAAERGCTTVFVGDGLNDGPAIAAADLGVAVEGALDAARTASAATFIRGGVERLPELLTLLASAGQILRQNIGASVLYNALAVPAALVGWVHPAVAAIAMAASSITVVLNSLRIRGIRVSGVVAPTIQTERRAAVQGV